MQFANDLNKLKAFPSDLDISFTSSSNEILKNHITGNMESKSAGIFLDIALRLGDIDGFLGVMFEGLGYAKLNGKFHNLYGPIKDIALLGLLKYGFSPIYIAREQLVLDKNTGKKVEVLYKWYTDNAQYISINAPLLTETQLETLVNLLVENPDMSMEDILKDLTANFEKYKNQKIFNEKELSKAIALQEAFGITINKYAEVVYTSEMQTWWYNYHLSGSPELPNGKPNLNYWQSVYNPS